MLTCTVTKSLSILVLVILAVAIRIAANPVANVFQKQLALRGHPPLLINLLTYTGLALGVTAWAFFLSWGALPATFWWYAILSALVGATGNGFLVKALEKGELSVLGPVNAYKSVIGAIAAVFILRELPGVWGIAGIVLIVAGSYAVLGGGAEGFSLALLKRSDITYRLLAMALTAIEAVLLKKMILLSSSLHTFIVWCWFGTGVAFLLLRVNGMHSMSWPWHSIFSDLLKYILLIGCIALMQFTTIYAFDHMPVGYALALFQLSILISVWLGYRYFREENLVRKLLGSIIMVLGAVCMILLGGG